MKKLPQIIGKIVIRRKDTENNAIRECPRYQITDVYDRYGETMTHVRKLQRWRENFILLEEETILAYDDILIDNCTDPRCVIKIKSPRSLTKQEIRDKIESEKYYNRKYIDAINHNFGFGWRYNY